MLYKLLTTLWIVSNCPPPIKKSMWRLLAGQRFCKKSYQLPGSQVCSYVVALFHGHWVLLMLTVSQTILCIFVEYLLPAKSLSLHAYFSLYATSFKPHYSHDIVASSGIKNPCLGSLSTCMRVSLYHIVPKVEMMPTVTACVYLLLYEKG